MIARITGLILLVQFLIAVGIFFLATKALGVNNAAFAVAVSIGTVLLIRMIITFNNFVLARRFRSELPLHYRIGWWQACMLFLTEFKATMISSSWTMPFHSFSKRIPQDPEGLPVLLIHGYGCNSGYWRSMSKALTRAKIAHYAVDMEPVIGGIDEYVPIIHAAIERICDETGYDKIILVGHSMGGLVARAYLRAHGNERIAKVITLGTPHHGTGLAHFGVGLNTQQMRWTATEQEGLASDWLRELATGEGPDTYRLFVSIYSHHDNIISPQTSSHLDGAKNIELNGVGHVALGFDPVVQAMVIREVRDASSAAAQPVHESAELKPA